MDVSKFTNKEMGVLVRFAGTNIRRNEEYDHFAFVPSALPNDIQLTNRTHTLVSKASMEIGRLQECVRRIPRPEILLRPSLAREAKSTSALEGTYAPLQEILEGDYLDRSQMSAAVREIHNYMEAAHRGLELIKTKPITINILSELQGILVEGTRGGEINQGEVRTGPVIIGDESKSVNEARFIPPPAGDELNSGLSEWEKWINAENDISPIIKMALGHYQFETLHPFADGNGRVGRLVITLQFVELFLLNPPVLNLSEWFNREKDKYKDGLLTLSQNGNFDHWVSFFCEAIIGQVTIEINRIERLLEFRDNLLIKLKLAKQRGIVLELPELLIGHPVVSINKLAADLGVTYPPARSAVLKLVNMGVLREITGRKNRKLYICTEVFNLLNT